MASPCPADRRYLSSRAELLDLVRSNPAASGAISHHLNRFLLALNDEQPYSLIQTRNERTKIDERIRTFDYTRSPAWRELSLRGWDQLSQSELLSVAQVLEKKLAIPLDREAKRRKNLLVKWFEENLADLRPVLDNIELVSDDSPDRLNPSAPASFL
jgi:hypothetical protein